MTATPAAALAPDNPFARPSTLPYSLPPFDKIRDEHFVPALEAGMAEQRREIDAIARNSQTPTFENTIVALERSGQLLTRVSLTFSNLTSSNSNPEIEKIQTQMSPKLSAHSDAIAVHRSAWTRNRCACSNAIASSSSAPERSYLTATRPSCAS
jgi:peptidyl-dipeptidase Dcp